MAQWKLIVEKYVIRRTAGAIRISMQLFNPQQVGYFAHKHTCISMSSLTMAIHFKNALLVVSLQISACSYPSWPDIDKTMHGRHFEWIPQVQ